MASVIKREELARNAIVAHMATFATLNVLEIVMTNVIREQAYVEAVQKENTVLTVIKHVQNIVKQVSVIEITVIVRNVW